MPFDWGSGLKTGVNISKGKPRASLTNGSSARKFIAKDLVSNNSKDENSRSNAEHVVEQAAGLKTVSMVVSAAASAARDSLQNVRDVIDSTKPNTQGDARKLVPSFSEDDLVVSQNNLAQATTDRIGPVPGEISTRLTNSAWDIFGQSLPAFVPPRDGADSDPPNTVTPDIESVSIDIDKKKGAIDCFYSTITFNVPVAAVQSGQIRAIRIFRAEINNPTFLNASGRLTARALDILRADPNRSRSKNQNYVSDFENRLAEAGIDNAVTALNAVDPVIGIRTGAQSASLIDPTHLSSISKIGGDDRVMSDLASFIKPDGLDGIDRSVSQDLKSIANLVRNNPHLALDPIQDVAPAGRMLFVDSSSRMGTAQLRQVRDSFSENTGVVITPPNVQKFKEIAFVSPDDTKRLRDQIFGDVISYSFDDPTVLYGRSYKYYVVTVDKNMHESTRSRIVQVNVDGLRVPDFPKRISGYVINGAISLNMIVEDGLVEKFEIYRREDSVPVSRQISSKEIVVMGSSTGFSVDKSTRVKLGNNFLQVGEASNNGASGGVFYDRTVKSGQRYTYRVYSVDIFGNKSESPREISIYVPNTSLKFVELRKPSILTQVDAKTNKVRVTIDVEDSRITSVFLGRRDLTLSQQAFVPPGEPNSILLGTPRSALARSRFLGSRIAGEERDTAWTGYFEVTPGDPIQFIDHTSAVDHMYQYRVYGIDRFGNKTPFEISKPLLVDNLPLVNEPINLSSSLDVGADGRIRNVRLSWNDGNIDISAESLLGNQQDLLDTSVRTLYQVQRRRGSEDTWHDFPLIENRFIDDPVIDLSGSSPPKFRPDFLRSNETYVYRVAAIQTGSFISNYSVPIMIDVTIPVADPQNFRITTPSTKQQPFYVVLNWDTPIFSGEIDHWEIERAVVNNLAAARLNLSNPADFKDLDFKPFRSVFLESSRFREATDDQNQAVDRSAAFPDLFTGQHHYLDASVQFGNSYFYRIRAVPTFSVSPSNWTYRGVKVTDESFEKKQDPVTSPKEKQNQATSKDPVGPLLPSPAVINISSFSIVPSNTRGKIVTRQAPVAAVPSRPVTIAPPPPANVTKARNMGSRPAVKILPTIIRKQ
jgi:hypothetical protein